MSLSELRGQRILVTGAAGFIGMRVVTKLLDVGARVTACVNPGEESRLSALSRDSDLQVVPCFLADWQAVSARKESFENIAYVVHLWVRVPSSIDFFGNAIEDINTNLLGTVNLTRVLGPVVKGICFASSVKVYGQNPAIPVREDCCPKPQSSYASSKLAQECYLQAYSQNKGVPVTALRYSTVFGPGEKSHRLIPKFLWSLSQGQALVIYGDGSEIRDYVYIDDVASATVSALEKNCGGVFNIGSGRGHTTLHIASAMMSLCGTNLDLQFAPSSLPKADMICDISAAKAKLGYEPQIQILEGLYLETRWFEREVLGRSLVGMK